MTYSWNLLLDLEKEMTSIEETVLTLKRKSFSAE